ncbi:MAG: ice-binding family protein [Verrucomicrobiales bacterium]|nr:ice-binding family protein [Verrucomicrobiales bacterium]
MKMNSQNKKQTLNVWRLTIGLAAAVLLSPHAAVAKQGGTDIQHFLSKSDMVNTGVEPSASGKIDVQINEQGKSSKQQMKITASKLNPNTAYQLAVFIGDDTNVTDIAAFTTDKKGGVTVAYMNTGQGKSNKKGHVFPEALDPLCNIRELDIVDGSSNAVLSAVLSNPDKGQYMVKNSMDNVGFLPAAVGDFRIKANSKSTQFLLKVSGLTAETDYSLAINGEMAQTYTSDSSGKLTVNSLPTNSPSVLEIQTLALTDGSGTNLVLITVGLGIPCTMAHQVPPSLGSAGSGFAVLAGSTVANTAFTTVNGDLGLSPGSAVTGFPPGIVTGTQHVADIAAAQAQLDLTVAYNDAAGRTVGAISVAGNLGGMTLPPGLYKSTSSLEISSGDLTLDAKGDANAVFIFQIASTLTTTSGRQVVLSGGAKAANVYWQVGTSAVLGTTSVFKGTIMADQSITLTTGATLEGRALARIAAVTLDSNVITIPAP